MQKMRYPVGLQHRINIDAGRCWSITKCCSPIGMCFALQHRRTPNQTFRHHPIGRSKLLFACDHRCSIACMTGHLGPAPLRRIPEAGRAMPRALPARCPRDARGRCLRPETARRPQRPARARKARPRRSARIRSILGQLREKLGGEDSNTGARRPKEESEKGSPSATAKCSASRCLPISSKELTSTAQRLPNREARHAARNVADPSEHKDERAAIKRQSLQDTASCAAYRPNNHQCKSSNK